MQTIYIHIHITVGLLALHQTHSYSQVVFPNTTSHTGNPSHSAFSRIYRCQLSGQPRLGVAPKRYILEFLYATNAFIRGVTMIMSAHIIHCVFHASHTTIMSHSIIRRVVRNYLVTNPLRFCTCLRTMINACNTCPYCMGSPKYESCVTRR